MGIFTHVALGTNDLARSKQFYEATLAVPGVRYLGPMGDNGLLYGKDAPELLTHGTYVRDPDGNKLCTDCFAPA